MIQTASAADIQRAYRKLAKKHHPDLNPGNAKAEERFKEISGANDLLSDPTKRGQFDRGEIDAAGQAKAPRASYRDYADGPSGQRYGRIAKTLMDGTRASLLTFSDPCSAAPGPGGATTRPRARRTLFASNPLP